LRRCGAVHQWADAAGEDRTAGGGHPELFVGALQVITPTVLIVTAKGSADQILDASGIFLFGFTYLYVGIGLLGGFDTTGVYFSLFVPAMAVGYSLANFEVLNARPFGVIWLYWAFLWLLGLKTRPSGPLQGLGDGDPGMGHGGGPYSGGWGDEHRPLGPSGLSGLSVNRFPVTRGDRVRRRR
jgi:hypothetical protein